MLDTLKNKKNLIALVGASNDPKKYGNKILLDLISKGYNVAPINNQEEMISGIKSYKNEEKGAVTLSNICGGKDR